MFTSQGVEDGYGVPDIFEVGIYSFFPLGVPGLVALLVNSHGIPDDLDSITNDVVFVLPGVSSTFPGRVYVGSATSVHKKLTLKQKI